MRIRSKRVRLFAQNAGLDAHAYILEDRPEMPKFPVVVLWPGFMIYDPTRPIGTAPIPEILSNSLSGGTSVSKVSKRVPREYQLNFDDLSIIMSLTNPEIGTDLYASGRNPKPPTIRANSPTISS
jgi:hypothetical protein